MKELIKIETRENKETVNARDLHEFLKVKSRYRDWIKNHIRDFDFQESYDFVAAKNLATSGQTQIDYYISIDMAKELSMLQRNNKGKEARKYFIECENRLKSTILKLPQTYVEALECLLSTEKEKVKLTQQKQQLQIENTAKEEIIKEQKPKVEFFNTVTDSKTAIEMSKVAKILDMNLGRNQLFSLLRNNKILRHNNEPYQQYIDCGYFRVIEQKYIKSDGDTNINIKTLVYQRGLDFIRKLIDE